MKDIQRSDGPSLPPLGRVSFDRVAHLYDETRRLPEHQIQLIVEALSAEVNNDEIVLEVGVGTGLLAIPLQKRGVNLIGMDISPLMMAQGAEKGLRNVLLADALHLPVKDKSVDVTFSVHVLHLIKDWRGALKEIARVTRRAYYTIASYEDERSSPAPGSMRSLRKTVDGVLQMPEDSDATPHGIVRGVRWIYQTIVNFWSVGRFPAARYWRSVRRAGYTPMILAPGERDLPNIIPPRKTRPIGTFVDLERTSTIVEDLDAQANSSQWAIPEAVHQRAMRAARRGLSAKTLRIKRTIELIRWNANDLTRT